MLEDAGLSGQHRLLFQQQNREQKLLKLGTLLFILNIVLNDAQYFRNLVESGIFMLSFAVTICTQFDHEWPQINLSS